MKLRHGSRNSTHRRFSRIALVCLTTTTRTDKSNTSTPTRLNTVELSFVKTSTLSGWIKPWRTLITSNTVISYNRITQNTVIWNLTRAGVYTIYRPTPTRTPACTLWTLPLVDILSVILTRVNCRWSQRKCTPQTTDVLATFLPSSVYEDCDLL